MASSKFPLLLSLFLLLHQPFSSKANLLKTKILKSTLFSQLFTTRHLNQTQPALYFEVTKPIKLPRTKPCSILILSHDFGFTYGKPPVLANYTPPSHCTAQQLSKIVLEFKATCKGTQFDRIFGIWLGGVELLRSCTAEPTESGIVWSVEKDITRYHSLIVKNKTQTLAVYLGNIVDNTYTGVYHVNVTIHFYPAEEKLSNHKNDLDNLASGFDSNADLILPISRNLPLNDGLWFEIKNSMDNQEKEFRIPQNVYRAVLEVYLSFHENDEFWYTNLPNEFISINELTDTQGNGPFREIVVSLDGEVVGAIWPFTVIYTGGINPLFWSPITGIGSFDLPSYDIEITPFLGNILDGEMHKFSFSITNALNVWFIDANLHLWLDTKSSKTQGKLLKHEVIPLHISLLSDFKGLDGKFLTNVSRSISATGWIKSSYGEFTTHWIQDFGYSNSVLLRKNENLQIISQMIHFHDSVYFRRHSSVAYSQSSHKVFPFHLSINVLDRGNGSYTSITNVTLGYYEEKAKSAGFDSFFSSLKNLQKGQVAITAENNFLVDASWSTQQIYKYHGTDLCYFRNISSSNNIVAYDKVRNTCKERTGSHLSSEFHGWLSSPGS
ncbi:Peptide-N4-(N-acetyl-beta-glucosaminyl)asparagine amidase A [Melia azedarach]|uniref:Peptide-N4-(N-acetyl-beta-glucosaminyl)asparagine amidase A n=1 Tax=Melia azedarach TaxID=155640 RepID=A0ACC1YSM5_MELAZ|nr:Peptide-N4-(N-acetyl-beta-glucosaminyl)asparagine amidase A [Melia azedarach]